MNENFDITYKFLILGDTSVGKTSFIQKYSNNSFNHYQKSTVGIDYSITTIRFKDKNIKAIDIGCGSGYMTLCLAKLLGPYSKVIGLDHIKEIIEFSYKNIHKSHKFYLESGRIKFIMKDGIDGFMEDSPYDLIHVGAAVDEIP